MTATAQAAFSHSAAQHTAVRGSDVTAHPLAVSVADAAKIGGQSRTVLYQAMSPDPKKRNGLPFLPSLKVGKRRLVLVETYRQWLVSFESRPDALGDPGQ